MKSKNVIKIGLFVGALILILTSSISLGATRSSKDLKQASPSGNFASISGEVAIKNGENCHLVYAPAYPEPILTWVCE